MATTVTITTNSGSTNYTLSTGARGPAGADGSDATISLSQNKLAGRGASSGTGNIQEITLGANLSLSGTTLNAAGGTVDNAAVNEAIAENPSATRDILKTGIPTQTVNLFCQGDSMTAVGTGGYIEWPVSLTTRTATWNRLANVTVTNVAVGGQTTAHVISSQKTASLQPTTYNAKIAVCLIGTNNLLIGHTGAYIFSQLLIIWDEAKRSGNTVVAVTVPKRDDTVANGGPYTAAMETQRLALNVLIRDAATWNVPPFDVIYDASNVFDPLDYATYYHDLLHFNQAGNDAFAAGLAAVLRDPGFDPATRLSLADVPSTFRRLQTTVTSHASNYYTTLNTNGLDETILFNLGATKGTLILEIPLDKNTRIGQEITFQCAGSTTITAFAISPTDGSLDDTSSPATMVGGQSITIRKTARSKWTLLSPPHINSANVDFRTTTAGKTLAVKSGTNALAGTVTLSSGAGTISSTAIDANTVIVLTLKTVSGTVGGQPYVENITAGTSATLAGGGGSNNSTYNWVALKVN